MMFPNVLGDERLEDVQTALKRDLEKMDYTFFSMYARSLGRSEGHYLVFYFEKDQAQDRSQIQTYLTLMGYQVDNKVNDDTCLVMDMRL